MLVLHLTLGGATLGQLFDDVPPIFLNFELDAAQVNVIRLLQNFILLVFSYKAVALRWSYMKTEDFFFSHTNKDRTNVGRMSNTRYCHNLPLNNKYRINSANNSLFQRILLQS